MVPFEFGLKDGPLPTASLKQTASMNSKPRLDRSIFFLGW
jgi:hypothetical protein